MKALAIAAVALLLGTPVGGQGAAAEHGEHHGKGKCGPEMHDGSGPEQGKHNPITDSITMKLMGEIETAAKAAAESESDPRIGADVPTDEARGADYWSGLLQVVQVSDPLLTQECRRAAVLRALEVTGRADMIRAHMQDSIERWDVALEGTRPIRISEYLGHLAECKDFCRPLMGLLLRCHVDAVRSSPHLVVFFDVDRPLPGESLRGLLEKARNELAVFAGEMDRQGRDLALYARASILGPSEDFGHNQRLATRRGGAVEDALREAGFRGRILKRPVAWEPPRLAVREIADYFGFGPHWAQKQNPQHMDQSVVVVGF